MFLTRPFLRSNYRGGRMLALLLCAACSPAATVNSTRTVDTGAGPRLPPVPEARGELRIDMVYPGEGANVSARDSTFLFGNLGRGDARLTINGAAVNVAPNGAWLAFLPVPPDGVYQLSASAEGRTVTATRTVRVPSGAVTMTDGALRIIEGSASPGGVNTRTRGDRIEVSFRGTPGGLARLRLPDGSVVPMVERAAVNRAAGFMLDQTQHESGVAEYVGTFELASTITLQDRSIDPPTLPPLDGYLQERDRQATTGAVFELERGGEVVRLPFAAAIGVLEAGHPRVAIAATTRPDSTVIGRRQLGADQAWDFFWPNGTLLPIDAEAQGFYRVRLTRDITAWVSRDDVHLLEAGTPRPSGFVGPTIQLTPRSEWVDVRFGASEELPFRVDPSEDGLSIEFYGATGRPAYVGYGPTDDFVQRVDWAQQTDELFRFNIHLTRPLWGYRYRWEGSSLLLQVRRPPVVDPARPLRGLRIAVDAGHRGAAGDIGAIGPTRLTEVETTLQVTHRLVPLLREAGAEVVEIRPDTTIVPLVERPVVAERAEAQLLTSVHFNAFPDGVNPFENHGTTVFYYWPHSLVYARHMQREILAELGLPDRGVRFQNLGMTRTSWMPSILTETLFMMFPEQEAALRNPSVIERIAQAHLRAMEAFVRDRGTPQP